VQFLKHALSGVVASCVAEEGGCLDDYFLTVDDNGAVGGVIFVVF